MCNDAMGLWERMTYKIESLLRKPRNFNINQSQNMHNFVTSKFVQFLPIWLDRFTYYNFKMYKYEMRIPCKPKMQHITEQPLAAFLRFSNLNGEWHPLKIRVKKCMHVVCSWTLIKTSTEHFWRLSFYVHQTACHCLPFRSTACFCVATD